MPLTSTVKVKCINCYQALSFGDDMAIEELLQKRFGRKLKVDWKSLHNLYNSSSRSNKLFYLILMFVSKKLKTLCLHLSVQPIILWMKTEGNLDKFGCRKITGSLLYCFNSF